MKNKPNLKLIFLFIFIGLPFGFSSCHKEEDKAATRPFAFNLLGGETSIDSRGANAFAMPAPNLDEENFQLHLEGDASFAAVYVTAPSEVNPGLGPIFNNASCNSCHVRNGRGLPSIGNGALRSHALVRVSLNDPDLIAEMQNNASVPVPGLGLQIQDHAIFGHKAEADVKLDWQEIPGKYPDGTAYTLRKPKLTITLPDGKPLADNVMTSLRIAPPVFGLGLLEAIPESTLLELEKNQYAAKGNVTGKVNKVWDPASGKIMVGRFGHKANTATLLTQAAAAFVNDMGISNMIFPEDNDDMDIDENTLKSAAQYTQTLAVPERQLTDDKNIIQGELLFAKIGCESCHVATLKTGNHQIAALSQQTIHPFTDLLVHDMGSELADGRPDFLANGQEWRTAPLWGIGLTHTVLPQSGFLHDGRARSIEEAILWHGGEAEESQVAFKQLEKEERQAILSFLNSL